MPPKGYKKNPVSETKGVKHEPVKGIEPPLPVLAVSLPICCGNCRVWVSDGIASSNGGVCKFNPSTVRKPATDWCGRFIAKGKE